MRRAPLLAVLIALLPLAGCGRDDDSPRSIDQPRIGLEGTEKQAATDLGFPAFATKNTTRVGGADPIANAVATARAVYPSGPGGGPAGNRARAVALADQRDWRAALAASVLQAGPVRAPLLLSDGTDMPAATQAALDALGPLGSPQAGNAQLIRVGDVPRPADLRTTDIRGKDPFALARAIDAFVAAARGSTTDSVMVVSADRPEYAMPAAAYAAKSGTPILFVRRDAVPPDTAAALRSHQQPKIYVVGPSKVISPEVTDDLRKLGTVTRVGGPDPVRNAIEFAAFKDGAFGWGIQTAGHGLTFVRADRTLDAVAAAPLATAGKYNPVLLLDHADRLPVPLREYLLDLQPGYRSDPVEAFYNHAWLLGDTDAISVPLQSTIDEILEIRPENVRSR